MKIETTGQANPQPPARKQWAEPQVVEIPMR